MSQVYWFEKDAARRSCPCLFLDRDGVIVEEVRYLHRRGDVRLLAGAGAIITAARAHGFAVGLVTNQAGIGRGYYDWAAFAAVQDEIMSRLELGPEPFDFVAACASHPEAVDRFHRVTDHSWRKPNPGMLRMAVAALDLDLAGSLLVGDASSDIEAGLAAGIGRLIHVRTGHGAEQRHTVEALCHPAVHCAEDLTEARAYAGW